MESQLDLPTDLQLRLMQALSEDIDNRLRELTLLVSLQETELAYLGLAILCLFGLLLVNQKGK